MLQIGSRSYRLVRAQSGLHVRLDPTEPGMREQEWRLDAHFVPADEDTGGELEAGWEYWRLHVNPFSRFRVEDWRELARGSFCEDEEIFFFVDLENLMERGLRTVEERGVRIGDFRITRREGYLFTCEMEGTVAGETDGAAEEEFRMEAEIPFATVWVQVPLNAGDPVAAARAIAARELKLGSVARHALRRYDPERAGGYPRTNGKHSVTLETPWHGSPV